tara:strand:+ start:137249 stop:137413 length:165 start_codon:yes stop_codon:yes gene_type:complete
MGAEVECRNLVALKSYPDRKPTMKKNYQGKLPKPNKNGYYRPEIGGARFTPGNK